jgi:uncharacterized protein YndB with AHSA1/START domain
MNTSAEKSETRAIVIEDFLPHSPELVWRAITDPAYLDRWMMKNDFQPVVGHRFTFQAQPMGDWNGIVECEVLECDPPRKLAYTWVGGSSNNSDYGTALDSVLTITLAAAEGGTKFKLVHDGFRSPQNDFGFTAMSSGWGSLVKRIDALLSEIA